ncbi:MAG: AsmA-like C-terminal region-containing protein [Nitrospirales bacterium]
MRVSVTQSILGVGLGLLVLSAVLIILPWFLNPDYVKTLVLRQIQDTLGSQVRVGRTSFALFPSPHFLVSDIVVQERPDSHAVFRAQTMNLELGIGQLLQKKLVVKEFFLDYPEIEIHRDKNGAWRLLGQSNQDSSLASLASFLVFGRLEVANGKIIVIDESPSDSVRGVVFENVAGVSETSYEGATVLSHLTVSGNLRQAQDAASFRMSGTLEGVSNVPWSALDGQDVKFEQMTLAGQLEADNFAVNQLAEFGAYGEILSQFPGALKAASQFKWLKKKEGSQLHLTNIAFANSAITLAGHANIEQLEDGHHMAQVSLRSSSLNLEMIPKMLPQAWLPDPIVDLWKEGKWGGELEVVEARISGSTREDVGTSLAGTFRVKNGFVHIPTWPSTDHVRGTVVVEPDRIQISDAQGIYDGIVVDVTRGIFLFKESSPWGDVEIRGDVPVEKVWDFVTHLRPSAAASHGLQAWKVSQGQGPLVLQFSGPLFEDEGLRFQQGVYEPQDVVFTIPGLPHALSHGHGKVTFSPDSTVFDGIQGEMGIFPWSMNGTLIHQGTLRFEPLNVTAGFDGRDVLAPSAHGQTESGGLHLIGPLQASVVMRGPMNRLNIKGKIDGKKARMSLPSILKKGAGQAAVLEFDGQLVSGHTARLTRIELAMLPLRVRGQGTVRFRPTWVWEGRLDSGPVSIALLPEKVQVLDSAIQSGIVEVQLGGKGLGPDWTQWDVKGWVAITDGVVRIPGLSESVSNLFVRLRIEKDLLDLKRMEFHLNDSEAVVTGLVKQWSSTPQVSLVWNAPRFDLDVLIPKDERSVLRDGVEWLAHHGKLAGSVLIERPRYKTFLGQTLSAELNMHDNLVTMDKIQTTVEKDGSLKGRVLVHLPPGKPAAVRASFKGENLPFEKFLTVVGDERDLVTGQMTIRGKVQGHGRDEQGVIPTLEGGIELEIKNGYVRQGRVLPKILKLLNLPHVLRGKVSFEKSGFPFESISSTLTIEEGNFSTKDFILRSPIMNATVAGRYDFNRDDLDGAVAVSPFGAYSDLLKSIPLFGKIFSGDRNGLATAMFNLNGPLAEPEVVYLPQESFKNGLTGFAQLAFDVLNNTVLLPIDVLKESKNSASSPLDSLRSQPPGSLPLTAEEPATTPK